MLQVFVRPGIAALNRTCSDSEPLSSANLQAGRKRAVEPPEASTVPSTAADQGHIVVCLLSGAGPAGRSNSIAMVNLSTDGGYAVRTAERSAHSGGAGGGLAAVPICRVGEGAGLGSPVRRRPGHTPTWPHRPIVRITWVFG